MPSLFYGPNSLKIHLIGSNPIIQDAKRYEKSHNIPAIKKPGTFSIYNVQLEHFFLFTAKSLIILVLEAKIPSQ